MLKMILFMLKFLITRVRILVGCGRCDWSDSALGSVWKENIDWLSAEFAQLVFLSDSTNNGGDIMCWWQAGANDSFS